MACSLCVFLTWQSVIDYDITAARIQILQERSLIAKVVRSLPLKSYIYCWASDVFLVHNFGHKPCIWLMPISAHLGHKWLHEEVILWCLPLGFADSQQCQKFSKCPIENPNNTVPSIILYVWTLNILGKKEFFFFIAFNFISGLFPNNEIIRERFWNGGTVCFWFTKQVICSTIRLHWFSSMFLIH